MAVPGVELDGPVVEHRRRRAAGHGCCRTVEEGRRSDEVAVVVVVVARSYKRRPLGDEGAKGVAVGDTVVADHADDEAAALVAVELYVQHRRPNFLLWQNSKYIYIPSSMF